MIEHQSGTFLQVIILLLCFFTLAQVSAERKIVQNLHSEGYLHKN